MEEFGLTWYKEGDCLHQRGSRWNLDLYGFIWQGCRSQWGQEMEIRWPVRQPLQRPMKTVVWFLWSSRRQESSTRREVAFFFFFFWLHCVPYGILGPWSGIGLRPLAVKAQSPNHWTAREFPGGRFNGSIIIFPIISWTSRRLRLGSSAFYTLTHTYTHTHANILVWVAYLY